MTYGYIEIPEDYWICSHNIKYYFDENDND